MEDGGGGRTSCVRLAHISCFSVVSISRSRMAPISRFRLVSISRSRLALISRFRLVSISSFRLALISIEEGGIRREDSDEGGRSREEG